IPLLAEGQGRYPTAGTIVVDIDESVAVRRLVESRGFAEQDARARIAAQATREERRAIADRVIDNSGDLASLESQVEDVFRWAQNLRESETTND
ncbi:MAG: dephospho-CoA kinase, partial [Acidimicrobiales bacterium]